MRKIPKKGTFSKLSYTWIEFETIKWFKKRRLEEHRKGADIHLYVIQSLHINTRTIRNLIPPQLFPLVAPTQIITLSNPSTILIYFERWKKPIVLAYSSVVANPSPPKIYVFLELSILQFYIETLKGVKPICYSKKWKIRTVKIKFPLTTTPLKT